MRKLGFVTQLVVLLLVFTCSVSYSRSIDLSWGGEILDRSGVELQDYAAILIINPGTNGVIDAPNMNNRFFLGGDDIVASFSPAMDWTGNPLGYIRGATGKEYRNIALLTPEGYGEGGVGAGFPMGDTYQVYVRVFDNLDQVFFNTYEPDFSPSDPSKPGYGEWTGEYLDPGLGNTFYADSQMVEVRVEVSSQNVQFLMNPMQTDMPVPAGEPVPEPSAMLLAAVGLAWLGRRIKKI